MTDKVVPKRLYIFSRSLCSICRDPDCGGRDDHRLIGFRSTK